jgi:hypothetical protein
MFSQMYSIPEDSHLRIRRRENFKSQEKRFSILPLCVTATVY